MKIPVRNVYYMLCYAWGHAQYRELVAVGATPAATLPELLAVVLTRGVSTLLRRGVDRGYVGRREEEPRIRGKLDVATTVKALSLLKGRAACEVSELEYDVLHNQILRSTLHALLQLDGFDRDVARDVWLVYERFPPVHLIRPTAGDFRRVQLHRNNWSYDFLLKVCQLLFDNLVPNQQSGIMTFHDFRREDAKMWRLFEDFAAEFYAREQREYTVKKQAGLHWHEATAADPRQLAYLPAMRPDLVLEASSRRIILDTKYYSETMSHAYGSKSVHSGNLYQIFSYIENRNLSRPDGPPHEGILLYPAVEASYALDYRLKGHRVQVRTIDLDGPWERIHEDMLAVLS